MFLNQELVEVDVDTSSKIENQILTDEIQDTELLNFAIENYTELFMYIKDGIINIRICRDITGPPKRSSGKQDVVWGGIDIKISEK